MNDRDLPEGVRLLLIAGLELAGQVMRADLSDALSLEETRWHAERLYVLASEHIEIEGELNGTGV